MSGRASFSLGESGPLVARAFHRTLGAIAAIAFGSLAVQLELLFGARGLAPMVESIAFHRDRLGEGFFALPSAFHFDASDDAQALCVGLGLAVALLMTAGFRPRRCAFVLWLLYLGFAGPGDPFLGFQWDNLLLECLFLAIWLPTDRPARWIHALLLALAAKLYFESALAKALWGGAQWWTGEAMDFYYETSPLPGPLAWWFHNLPHSWHVLESRAIVAIEFVAPLAFFGPRPVRLGAVAVLTGFQLVNVATANYGFFVPLALALHLFALEDRDLRRLAVALRRPSLDAPVQLPSAPSRWRSAVAATVAAIWCIASVIEAEQRFAHARAAASWAALWRHIEPWRLVSTYHLFGPITVTRDEIEFQVRERAAWRPLAMRHKPGPLARGGVIVWPHQPRVEFQLWFYAFAWQRPMPSWVERILERLCDGQDLVQPLFVDELPARPEAVRIAVFRYHMTDRAAEVVSGAAWTREPIAVFRPWRCNAWP